MDDIIIKLSLKELELLIESLERSKQDNEDETRLRKDLKQIRLDQEIKRKREAEEMAQRPKEEIRLMPNPTSAEHIE
jgi:hypothetical protein|tara:strand:+ start:466 stop:696 length:231 start_codon:yes stop_codon:yes gene_type:complete